MASAYKEIAKIFKAFCDENRLQILELLRSGEKCACTLLDDLHITQSTLSQRAFLLTPQAYNSHSQTHRNKSILLKTLYEVNPSCLLQVFSKNA